MMIRRVVIAAVLLSMVAGAHCNVIRPAYPTDPTPTPTPPYLSATNPILASMADPDVLRVDDTDGTPLFLLTHTVGDDGDFPLYTSKNLVDWTLHGPLLGVKIRGPGDSVQMGDYHYCDRWAPEIRPSVQQGGYILSFTSSRYAEPQSPCPGYDEGSGTFVAWSESFYGPFDRADAHPEPIGTSLDPKICPLANHLALPHSTIVDQHDCDSSAGILCNNTARLDPDLFNDPLTGESWFAYSWYTNSEATLLPWEEYNLGEHVSLVKVNASDPTTVECSSESATKVWAASPHDAVTQQRLQDYCPRCDEQLSFVKGRLNETMMRGKAIWGVVEGAMLFRRNNYVYLLMSHSCWDSAYYSVMWSAAPTVEELSYDNQSRLVGRYLIPSMGQSFGHGTAVLGPDNIHWYYIHHHLNHTVCNSPTANCDRDVYIQPMEFEDRGDGLGDVWITERFPAEQLTVQVYQANGQSISKNHKEERKEDEDSIPSIVDMQTVAIQ